MSGAVCFRGTCVPVSILFEYLQEGRLADFYLGYPNVAHEQVMTVLEASKDFCGAL